MPLTSPNLDDRTFDQLVTAATSRVQQACPDWELAAGDPAQVLLEAFAYVTETMLYRLNRIPEKAYIEFLALLGVQVQPPTAASVELLFRLPRVSDKPLTIPAGTRVTVARPSGAGDAPVFTTVETAVISAGTTEVRTMAYHADLIAGELVGYGTGMPRLSVTTRRAPIVAPTSRDLQLVVAIETTPDRLDGRVRSLKLGDKVYRVWQETDAFANVTPTTHAYLVDRITGTITFAPSIRKRGKDGFLDESDLPMAVLPPNGKEIRAWYWRGGGAAGNVAAGSLTVLKDAIPGVSVTNPARAAGGREAETLQNALDRGPQEFRSLERAVTASDFRLLAESHGAVSRANAITRVDAWAHANPGTVEVLLVPQIPAESLAGPLSAQQIAEFQTENTRADIQQALDQRKPLGTSCLATWTRYKSVRVKARIVTYWEENAEALGNRIREKLYATINPNQWTFGQPLRASRIFDIILSEPGVSYVDRVLFGVDDAPAEDTRTVISDNFQKRTWHAGCGARLYRSMNDGEGWELTATFADEVVVRLAAHQQRPGLLAVITSLGKDGLSSGLRFSFDCGESWTDAISMAFPVEGLAWSTRDDVPVLFLATGVGLYEVSVDNDRSPLQVRVDSANPQRGFNAIAVVTDVRGGVSVAVAAQGGGGVFLSPEGGKSDSFGNVGLANEDVRVLRAQYDGPRGFLWAGFAASAGAAGTGAARIELIGSVVSQEGWRRFSKGWSGGSCWSLAFRGNNVFAASYQAGVLRMDWSNPDMATWIAPDLNSGLPQREVGHIFQWVKSTAASPTSNVVLCGTTAGVYRSVDGGVTFQSASARSFSDKVTLPNTWLFCSGEHEIEVLEEHENK